MTQEATGVLVCRTTTDFGIPTLEDLEDTNGQPAITKHSSRDYQEMGEDFDAKLQKHKNLAYALAETLNKSYVEDQGFRMMFLKANNYNTTEAASQMMEFLDQKLKYFGRDLLTQEIRQEDLSLDDKVALNSGMIQELVEKDGQGRTVIALFQNLRQFNNHENMVSITPEVI